jgi:hypothetical protein
MVIQEVRPGESHVGSFGVVVAGVCRREQALQRRWDHPDALDWRERRAPLTFAALQRFRRGPDDDVAPDASFHGADAAGVHGG